MLISGCDSPVPLVRGKQQGTPPSYHLCREGSRGLPILWPQKAQPGVETMLLTSQVLFSGSFPFEFRSQERLWRETLPHPFCFFTALDWILTSYPGHLPLRGWWPFQAPAPLESSYALHSRGSLASALGGGTLRCLVADVSSLSAPLVWWSGWCQARQGFWSSLGPSPPVVSLGGTQWEQFYSLVLPSPEFPYRTRPI